MSDNMVVHIGSLTFDPAFSLRWPTRISAALELVDHMLTDGSVSRGDPLVLHAGDETIIREC
eukprot:3175348-Pyramimonas_sp.AAC.1